jgi:hypothetical protein
VRGTVRAEGLAADGRRHRSRAVSTGRQTGIHAAAGNARLRPRRPSERGRDSRDGRRGAGLVRGDHYHLYAFPDDGVAQLRHQRAHGGLTEMDAAATICDIGSPRAGRPS